MENVKHYYNICRSYRGYRELSALALLLKPVNFMKNWEILIRVAWLSASYCLLSLFIPYRMALLF